MHCGTQAGQSFTPSDSDLRIEARIRARAPLARAWRFVVWVGTRGGGTTPARPPRARPRDLVGAGRQDEGGDGGAGAHAVVREGTGENHPAEQTEHHASNL